LITSNDLRRALADRTAVRDKVASIAKQRRDVGSLYTLACDRLVETEKAFKEKRALFHLGEVSSEELAKARADYEQAVEDCDGLEQADNVLRERATNADAELVKADERVAAEYALVVVPHRDRLRDELEYLAPMVADKLRLFYQLDCAARLGGGFRSGPASAADAGNLGAIFASRGLWCDDGNITCQMRERTDDLRPEQFLKLIDS
jgi:hypothetical protein